MATSFTSNFNFCSITTNKVQIYILKNQGYIYIYIYPYKSNFGNGTQYIDPNKRKYKKAF